MTRKAAWAGFSFCAALMLAAAFRSENNLIFLLTAFGLAVIFFAALKNFRQHTILCFTAFAVGIAVNSYYTYHVYNRLVDLDGKKVTINGYVKDITQLDGKYDRVTVCGKIDSINAEISYVLPYGDIHYYDEISVTDTVNTIEDGVRFNSGSYNYSKSVFLQGGYGTGSYDLSGRSVNPVFRGVREYRDKLFEKIMTVCPKREGSFLGAMLCGDKSEMSSAMKTELYRSGLGHIFAVSGIHLVIAASLFGYIIGKIIKAKKAVFILTLAEIWGFAVFAGLSVSVVRAAVMMTLTRSGTFFGRKSDGLNSLGLSAVLLTFLKPYTAVSPSFILSFLAVAAIELVLISSDHENDKVEITMRLSASVLFMTAPASALLFGGISIMSLLTNLLLVPVCTISLQLCFIVLFTGGTLVSTPLLIAAVLPVKFVLFCSDKLATLDFSYVFTSSSVITGIVIVSSVIMVFVCTRSKEIRKLLLCTCTVLAVWCASANIVRFIDDDYKLTILPDRKRTAYMLSRHGIAIIFDVGCKGRMDSALQHQMDKLGIREMPYAFILENGVITAAGYKDDLYLNPDTVFVCDDITNNNDNGIVYLDHNNDADTGDIKVRSADGGFILRFEDNDIFLGKGKVVINGEEVDISTETDVLEYDGKYLRRL